MMKIPVNTVNRTKYPPSHCVHQNATCELVHLNVEILVIVDTCFPLGSFLPLLHKLSLEAIKHTYIELPLCFVPAQISYLYSERCFAYNEILTIKSPVC